MTDEAAHPKEEIQDLLDRRLDQPERARVEAHLRDCESCGREAEILRRVKEAVGRAEPKRVEAPKGLDARVLAALDHEDRQARRGARSWRRLGVYAAAAAAAFLVVYFLRPRDLPTEVAREYERYRSAAISLDLRTGDPRTLERFFAQHGVPFPTRVFDLDMMRYELLGGRVLRLRNRPTAYFVYRSPENRVVVCQMFEGTTEALPEGAGVREHNGFRFFIYRRGAETVVFWQEGGVVCVLSSDIASEEVVGLAFAKAMKASP